MEAFSIPWVGVWVVIWISISVANKVSFSPFFSIRTLDSIGKV
jgi:hypothetical protein